MNVHLRWKSSVFDILIRRSTHFQMYIMVGHVHVKKTQEQTSVTLFSHTSGLAYTYISDISWPGTGLAWNDLIIPAKPRRTREWTGSSTFYWARARLLVFARIAVFHYLYLNQTAEPSNKCTEYSRTLFMPASFLSGRRGRAISVGWAPPVLLFAHLGAPRRDLLRPLFAVGSATISIQGLRARSLLKVLISYCIHRSACTCM
jgi:hypothetical protein